LIFEVWGGPILIGVYQTHTPQLLFNDNYKIETFKNGAILDILWRIVHTKNSKLITRIEFI
jgi:hypothetical protein